MSSGSVQAAGRVSAQTSGLSYRDKQLEAQTLNPAFDLRAWAAYTLGLHCRKVRSYNAVARSAALFGVECFNAVLIPAYEIVLACDLLAGTAPPSLTPIIAGIATEWQARYTEAEAAFVAGRVVTSDPYVDSNDATRLAVLADQVTLADAILNAWYCLGRAFGQFVNEEQFSHPGTAVEFRPVADAARLLPHAERESMPELRDLGSLLDRPDSGTEEELRNLYVSRLASNWPFDDHNPWPDSPHFFQEVDRLSRRMQEHLRERLSAAAQPVTPPRPHWHPAEGLLYFGGRTVKQVRVHATKVRPILDLFQRQHWPEWVETELDGEARKDVVASMNSGLSDIEFYRGGSAKGICWRRKSNDR
jgi:hypothetical protein